MDATRFVVRVVSVKGKCAPGYREGDAFEFSGLQTPPGGFCGAAYHAMFPSLLALTFGGKIPLEEKGKNVVVLCPDSGKVAFEISVRLRLTGGGGK